MFSVVRADRGEEENHSISDNISFVHVFTVTMERMESMEPLSSLYTSSYPEIQPEAQGQEKTPAASSYNQDLVHKVSQSYTENTLKYRELSMVLICSGGVCVCVSVHVATTEANIRGVTLT